MIYFLYCPELPKQCKQKNSCSKIWLIDQLHIFEIGTIYFHKYFFLTFTAPLLWILCLVDDSTDLPANVHFLQIPFLRDPCGDLEKFIQDQINGLKQHVPNKTNKQTNIINKTKQTNKQKTQHQYL